VDISRGAGQPEAKSASTAVAHGASAPGVGSR
jgi:hypothetical protein